MKNNRPKVIRVQPSKNTSGSSSNIPQVKRVQPLKAQNKAVKITESHKNINVITSLPAPNKDSVFIIGGGPSLNGFDFSRLEGHDTIVVNKAIEHVKRATYFITMDYTFLNKTKLTLNDINNRVRQSYFILNVGHPYIKQVGGIFTDTRNKMQYLDLYKFSGIIKSPSGLHKEGFGHKLSEFANGSNSGYCAIQLAVLLGYKNIYLLGFDMGSSGQSHFHSGYKQNQAQFYERIKEYRENVIKSINGFNKNSIYSCSETSTLNEVITYRNIDEVLENMKTEIKEPVKNLDNLMIVAYYTVNTPYEQEANKLIKSLKKLGLNYDVVGVPNLGDWQANTRFKAKFMLDMLDKHSDKNLLYVDSDAIVHSRPVLFENYDCDVAVRWQDFRWRQNECLSGTIFMANNEKTRELCKIWQNTNHQEGPNAKTFEQWNLGKAIQLMKKHGLIDKNLPPEYTFIFDSMRKMYPNAKPVIEHFQASRRLRNKV